ncbi:MAG: putative toxin-antitoxin system toxin component, PIN family [Selenomonadaceae bacterium]|nr:putative toxin-antitoxin system toxin component, PIN family [Selenomonadaceae bacterium]
MNIVIDTNVIVSAIFFGGLPKKLVEMLLTHEFEAYASSEILKEYNRSVNKVHKRYPQKPMRFNLRDISSACHTITPASVISVCRDPDDDKFIECAVDANCIYIVSGDKDLLSLEKYADIKILTVSDFLEEYFS